MTVHLIRSDHLYDGVPYAYASIAQPGAVIHTAGACPLDEHGQTVGVGDVALQARQAVANLIEALAQAGATMADVLKTTTSLTVFFSSTGSGDVRSCLTI